MPNRSVRSQYRDPIVLNSEKLKNYILMAKDGGERNYQMFLDWVNGGDIRTLANEHEIGMSRTCAILRECREYYERVAEANKGEELEDECWFEFRKLLLEISPESTEQVITSLVNAVMFKYGMKCDPILVLTLATPEEIRRIPKVRDKSYEILMNARHKLHQKHTSFDLWRIMELKYLLYFIAGDERLNGIDLMMLKLERQKIVSIDFFIERGAELLISKSWRAKWTANEVKLLEAAYGTALRNKYLGKDCSTLIVWKDQKELKTYPGATATDLQNIVREYTNRGYSVGIGGRMPRSHIRIISVNKKGNNENE